jgi:hypothetical protein
MSPSQPTGRADARLVRRGTQQGTVAQGRFWSVPTTAEQNRPLERWDAAGTRTSTSAVGSSARMPSSARKR